MKVVGTMTNVLVGIATCEIVLANMCDGGSIDTWLMCNGNGVGPILQLFEDLGIGLVV